jgi:3-phenylpropionate/trans-cinnamate dioxygenase ferredoxin reductase subunit
VNYSVLIVGAGHAGGRTAQALRRLGFTGSIGLFGEEADSPYERPPLSKEFLLEEADPASFQLAAPTAWRELDVDLRLCRRAVALDRERRQVTFDDGTSVRYEKLVLATGARARTLPAAASGAARFRYLRTLEDARALREDLAAARQLAVVGAGFIGLELASSARRLGKPVTVIEAASRVIARALPRRFGEWLLRLHRANGVDVRLGRQVTSGKSDRLELDDCSSVDADCIVAGIGAVPNDELASVGGLDVRDGILVDPYCRSSDPRIYAIGDVARCIDPATGLATRLESWRNAEDQAQTAARVICGDDRNIGLPVPWFWTDQHGRNVQIAGWPADDLTLCERGDPDHGPYLAYFLQGRVVRGTIGVDCGRDVRRAQSLIAEAREVHMNELPAPRGLRGLPSREAALEPGTSAND